MDTPGYDPVAATGQIAGGANLIAFTTGRGSCFGSVPGIKAFATLIRRHFMALVEQNKGWANSLANKTTILWFPLR